MNAAESALYRGLRTLESDHERTEASQALTGFNLFHRTRESIIETLKKLNAYFKTIGQISSGGGDTKLSVLVLLAVHAHSRFILLIAHEVYNIITTGPFDKLFHLSVLSHAELKEQPSSRSEEDQGFFYQPH